MNAETFAKQSASTYPIGTIYGIGRNYAEHVHELGNVPASEPVVFLKPAGSINGSHEIILPYFSSKVHYEVELVLLLGDIVPDGQNGEQISTDSVAGFGIGVDLTARDVQDRAKAAGLPWALAKGFAGSAVIREFLLAPLPDLVQNPMRLRLWLNGQLRQDGYTDKMIFSAPDLLNYLHKHFGLKKGDVIFTGTPAGVGTLQAGDRLSIGLGDDHLYHYKVR